MNSENPHIESATIEINCPERWQIFHRLQELEIQCWCTAYQPLTVQIDSAIALIQLWSVITQTVTPRSQLIDRLEACWQF